MTNNCSHRNKTFVRTNENFFDGDEEDIYDCDDCGKRITIYIPR